MKIQHQDTYYRPHSGRIVALASPSILVSSSLLCLNESQPSRCRKERVNAGLKCILRPERSGWPWPRFGILNLLLGGVSALLTVCFSSVVCWLPVWPQFIIYPQLIGLGVTQRNASRSQQPINGFNFPIRCGSVQESIKEVEPLDEDNDLYWPCVCRIDFLCYNVGRMLVWVKICKASPALEPNTCTFLRSRNKTVILCTCVGVRLLIFSDFISVLCFSRCCRSYGKCVQLPHKTQILPDRKQEIISLQKEREEDKDWSVIGHRWVSASCAVCWMPVIQLGVQAGSTLRAM